MAESRKKPRATEHAILAIGDLHCPFQHKDALDFLSELYSRHCIPARRNTCVSLGDEVDAHAFSEKHKPDPDGLGPGEEWQAAKFELALYMNRFPHMLICTSNHTARPEIKAFAHGLPSAFIRSVKETLNAPAGWHWADHWKIDGIVFEHGEGVSGAAGALKAANNNRASTVIGHLHSFGGVQWQHGRFGSVFGFNVGCLIDPTAYAFRYAKKLRTTPSLGGGVILDGVPLWFPMKLNSKGRWIGRL